MEQHEAKAPNRGRRKFLLAARGAGALGALAALAGRSTPAEAAAPPAADTRATSGYHETEHIRKYYSTARYW
jgi:hypothetical protein